MAIRVEKRCPSCRIALDTKSKECPVCGIKLHALEDCQGCINLSKGRFCKVFNDPNNPIMRDDGTCQGAIRARC